MDPATTKLNVIDDKETIQIKQRKRVNLQNLQVAGSKIRFLYFNSETILSFS